MVKSKLSPRSHSAATRHLNLSIGRSHDNNSTFTSSGKNHSLRGVLKHLHVSRLISVTKSYWKRPLRYFPRTYSEFLQTICRLLVDSCFCLYLLLKKWSFPIAIFSVNVTTSAVSCEFGHIYWRNPYWKTSFFVQWFLDDIEVNINMSNSCQSFLYTTLENIRKSENQRFSDVIRGYRERTVAWNRLIKSW